MPFIFERSVDRVDFPEHDEWVDIKTKLTYGEFSSLTRDDLKDLETEGQVNARIQVIMIHDWNLKDANGDIAPINKEFISILDGSQGARLLMECVKRVPKAFEQITMALGKKKKKGR